MKLKRAKATLVGSAAATPREQVEKTTRPTMGVKPDGEMVLEPRGPLGDKVCRLVLLI